MLHLLIGLTIALFITLPLVILCLGLLLCCVFVVTYPSVYLLTGWEPVLAGLHTATFACDCVEDALFYHVIYLGLALYYWPGPRRAVRRRSLQQGIIMMMLFMLCVGHHSDEQECHTTPLYGMALPLQRLTQLIKLIALNSILRGGIPRPAARCQKNPDQGPGAC